MILKIIGGLILWLLPIILVFPVAILLPLQEAAMPKATSVERLPFDEARAYLENEINTVDVAAAIGPSVAAINVGVPRDSASPFGNTPPELLPPELKELLPYLDEEVPQQQGSGSGFVVSLNG